MIGYNVIIGDTITAVILRIGGGELNLNSSHVPLPTSMPCIMPHVYDLHYTPRLCPTIEKL